MFNTIVELKFFFKKLAGLLGVRVTGITGYYTETPYF